VERNYQIVSGFFLGTVRRSASFLLFMDHTFIVG
jgi:hypothetical protein